MNHRRIETRASHTLEAQPSTAAFWLANVSVFFASIYWLTNQMTSVRADIGAAVFEWERAIPFIDWTIIPYGSIIGFFIASFFLCRSRAELNCHTARLVSVVLLSVVCFVLWPQRFVFQRPDVDGALGVLFQLLTAVDLPYNRTPSLHISVLVILWLLFARHTQGWMRHAVHAWFALIGVSVLTTYQHHVIDVPAGVLAGWLCVWLFPEAGQSRFAFLGFGKSTRKAARKSNPLLSRQSCNTGVSPSRALPASRLRQSFPSVGECPLRAACSALRVQCAKTG